VQKKIIKLTDNGIGTSLKSEEKFKPPATVHG
jgi:hypothetical protein